MHANPNVDDSERPAPRTTAGSTCALTVVPLKPWVPFIVGQDVVMVFSRTYLRKNDFGTTLRRAKSQALDFLARHVRNGRSTGPRMPSAPELMRLITLDAATNQFKWVHNDAFALRITLRYELVGREPETQVFETESIISKEEWQEMVDSIDSVQLVNWSRA